MLAFVEKFGLEGKAGDLRSKPYPLQIPVYHFLIMHVYQPPSNVFELLGGIISEEYSWQWGKPEIKPYKFEPIDVPMGLDKLVDVPIFHPL